MKRLFFPLAAALLALSLPLGAQFRGTLEELDDSETVHALKEHVAYLSGAQMEGRKAGSEGERMAAEYLSKALKDCGIDVLSTGSEFGIAASPDTIYSRNVVGFLQGWDKQQRDHYILVGARMDNLGWDTITIDGESQRRIYYGANGNASGMALMIELARRLSYARTLLRRSIIFVGFGGSAESFAGAWYFLNRSFKDDVPKIDAMVNLDMLGVTNDGLLAYTASNEDLNTVVQALQGELLPVQAKLVTQEPYPGDHIAFYDKQIPSVLFTTGRYLEHNSGRDSYDIINFPYMEKALEYIYSYVQHLANGAKPLFRNSSTQSASRKEQESIYSFSDVDTKPMFLNSPEPSIFLERWVYPYVKYPDYALENGIQGRVIVDFVIDEKGQVRDVKVARGVHPLLDDEAVRVVSASPKWKAGRHRGKKVKVALSIAVDFRLTKEKGKFGINGRTIK